ncbi:MAG: ComEA family DNA-binding protein, partial [Candidatus Hydrogenedentes bacterium]|nr:ComEA family DNA-binding protein [Candidatus Hydrogenedentota bacterium]
TPPQSAVSGWHGTGSVETPAPAEMNPRAGAKESGATPKANDAPKSGPLDLNSATAEELDALPGIGPKLAAEIIAYRTRSPFASVDDLTNVPGIGKRKLEALRNLVTVQGSAATPPAPKSEETAKPKRRAPSKTTSREHE